MKKKFFKAGKTPWKPGTEKQRNARNKVFTDHKKLLTELNCVHYCGFGGHLWYHTPPADGKLPDCPHRTVANDDMIQFFRVCPRHYMGKKRIKRKRWEDPEDLCDAFD